MNYLQINSFTHLIIHPLARKKLEMEIVYSSGGSLFEQSKDRGKKHLMEHCIASRTQEMDFITLKNYQFNENIFINAYTGPITMGLNASGYYQDFEKIADILTEIALQPTFDEQILQQEREIVLREIAERSGDPAYRLHYQTTGELFTADSYENHQVLGDSQMVAETVLEDFENLHMQNLEKSHLIISLSGGGIDPDYLQSKLKNILDKTDSKYIQTYLNSEQKLPVNNKIKNQLQTFSYKPVISDLAHEHADVLIYIPFELSLEIRPAVKIFEELFLRYYGVLYHKLRDEMGLIYSLYSSFQHDLQCLVLNFACEIKFVSQIVNITKEVFNDFNKYFDEAKFEKFKQVISKKMDITNDTLGSSSEFTVSMLQNYGVPQSLEEYMAKLNTVTKDDIQKVYQNIQSSLNKTQIAVVSKDKSIENIQFV